MNYLKVFKNIIIATMFIATTGLHAEKADIYVKDIIKGSYLDYYSENIKADIVSLEAFSYLDWTGKAYAKENNIDENTMLSRAKQNAEDYAIGFTRGYLKQINANYNPTKYYIIVDNYNVEFKETDYKLSTVISANVILFKK